MVKTRVPADTNCPISAFLSPTTPEIGAFITILPSVFRRSSTTDCDWASCATLKLYEARADVASA